MNNGTTNVDQANFHVMSVDPQKEEIKTIDSGAFPYNIDPEKLRKAFDRDGSLSIKLEGKSKNKLELPNEYKVKGKKVKKGTGELAKTVQEDTGKGKEEVAEGR